MRVGFREIGWVMGGRAIAAVGVLLSLKIVTEFLTVEQMGIFGLALAIANGLSRAVFNPLAQPMLRFAGALLPSGEIGQLIASYRRAYIFMLVLAMAVLAVLVFWPDLALGAPVLAVAVVIGCLIGLNTGGFVTMSSLRWRRDTALSHIFVGWGRGFAAIALMMVFGATPEVALLGYAAALSFCVIWQQVRLLRGAGKNMFAFGAEPEDRNDENWKQYRKYALPFFLIFGIDAIVLEIDKVVVATHFTAVQLGAYIAIQLLARMPTFFVVGIVQQVVYPIFFQGSKTIKKSEMTWDAFSQIIKIYLVVLLLLLAFAGAVWVFQDMIVRILINEDYVPYAYLLPLLLLGGVISHSARILQAPGLRAIGSHVFIGAKLLQLTVLGLSMLVLVPLYGLAGVALASIAAALALVVGIVGISIYYLS